MLGEEVKKWGRLKKCGYENPLGWRLAPGRESGRIDRTLLEFRRNYVVGRTESNLSNSECLKKKSKTHFKCGQRKLTPGHKAQHHGLWKKKKKNGWRLPSEEQRQSWSENVPRSPCGDPVLSPEVPAIPLRISLLQSSSPISHSAWVDRTSRSHITTWRWGVPCVLLGTWTTAECSSRKPAF